MTVRNRIRLALFLMLVQGLVGCGALAVTGVAPAGQDAIESPRDARITERITTLFVRDPLIPAMDIRVRTRGGVVTLSGRVPNASLAKRAVRIARSVPGVLRVVSRLSYGAD